MASGMSVDQEYGGPPVGALEFRLWEGNLGTRAAVLEELLRKAPVVSAHLPSFLPAFETPREVEFDRDGRVHHFVAHVTRRAAPDWRGAWKEYAACGRRVLFENHNQDWHPTDAGLCWPDEFFELADAGHEICLDVGHILYASMSGSSSEQEWRDRAEAAFEEFLLMPVAAAHLHTVDRLGGADHRLEGFDIGPWVRRIAERHPEAVLLVEVMDPDVSPEQKLAALDGWLTAPSSSG